jgi:F-type H+-transporting ATPase subunit b
LDKLGINLGFLLVQIFSFLILFVVLRAWVYKPIMDVLDKRRKTIAQGLEDARVAAEARANAERESNKILIEAQAKAAEVVREASARAETATREIRAEADAEMAKARERNLAEIEQERDRVLSEVRGQIAALAMAATHKLIGESLDEKRHRTLLEEFFSGVRSGRVTVLEGETSFKGHSAEVTSALPLTGDEQDAVKKDILTKVGNTASVTFRVDPNILGGLVVKVGDKIIDGSVAGQLQGLRQSLQ